LPTHAIDELIVIAFRWPLPTHAIDKPIVITLRWPVPTHAIDKSIAVIACITLRLHCPTANATSQTGLGKATQLSASPTTPTPCCSADCVNVVSSNATVLCVELLTTTHNLLIATAHNHAPTLISNRFVRSRSVGYRAIHFTLEYRCLVHL
jgi:hypothetical protein